MPEFLVPPSDESPASDVLFPDCRWVVEPPSPVLVCAVHGKRTPSHPRRECGAGPAVLCHVCLCEVVPCVERFSWTFLCPTCTGIETSLAAPFGASALTPHRGQSGTQADTLFGHRFPDRVHQPKVELHPIPGSGVQRLVVRDHLEGPSPLLLLQRHAEAEFALLGLDAPRPVTDWLSKRPSSPRASAEGYQRYAFWQHDWLLEVIPRLRDLEWLTGVAAGTDCGPTDPS